MSPTMLWQQSTLVVFPKFLMWIATIASEVSEEYVSNAVHYSGL